MQGMQASACRANHSATTAAIEDLEDVLAGRPLRGRLNG